MFLFSGAFFPIANLTPPLEWLARFTPLWHGVDLTRMLTLGTLDGPPALRARGLPAGGRGRSATGGSGAGSRGG